MTPANFGHARESGVATAGGGSASVSELEIGRSRWMHILREGWVGQQSFIAIDEIEACCSFRQGDALLDLGCGDGMFVQTLARRCRGHAYGLDPNPSFTILDGIGAILLQDRIETGLANPAVRFLDVDILLSCDALQYVEDPLQHLGAYLDHFQPRSLFCSMWLCDDQGIGADWGFASPVPFTDVETFCSERGLIARCSAHFRRRIHRQLESLVIHEESLRRLWGREQYERRRHLEHDATVAADAGHLRQVWAIGRKS